MDRGTRAGRVVDCRSTAGRGAVVTGRQWAVAILVLLTVAAVGEYVLAWVFGVDLPPTP